MELRWYAVYTKLNCELTVSKELTRRKIINYLPVNRIIVPGNFNRKNFEEPLFKSYVFVKVPESQLLELKKINGVINLLYCMGKPVIVDENEIDIIKLFIKDHINISIEKTTLDLNNTLNSNDNFTENNKQKILLSSLYCNIIGEPALKMVKSNLPKYLTDLSKLKVHYELKAILLGCILILSEL